MKEKNFENYLEKNNNLSKSTLSLRIYGYQLINKFVNLEYKIIEFKKLDDPDEEMEELLQEWINHIVKNPPNKEEFNIGSDKTICKCGKYLPEISQV